MGAVRFAELLGTFGSVTQAIDGAGSAAEACVRAYEQADGVLARAAACGARVISSLDAEYPVALKDLNDPPPVLFAIGDLAVIEPPVVAIVGTRRATHYGERMTHAIATSLARDGVSVISGMARGIDAAAHRAALGANGRTAAVLGTGVDIAYPAQHGPLHKQIGARGLLLSEELPGDHASAGSFPKRNRIIAALAQVTIVIEAPRDSGALITANHALDLGRTVATVPGDIDSPQSAGSNLLLRDGAIMIGEVADALMLFEKTGPKRPRNPEFKTGAELAVWAALGEGEAYINDLSARAGLPARECMVAVSALEVTGTIECLLTGEIRRRV